MTKGRVLVVDDDQSIQEMFREPIQESGFLVDTAGTRLEACEKIRCKTYHVAMIDIMLTDDPSDRGGLEVLRYLHSLDEGTRAIVVSATSDVRVPVDVMKQGTYVYLIKKDIRTSSDFLKKGEEEFAKCKLKTFGKFETFTAYIAGPGNAFYYEQDLISILKGGASSMFQFISAVFDPLLPLLRMKNSTYGLKIDHDKKTIYGLLWSKALGHAVWVSAGQLESEYFKPSIEQPSEVLYERKKGPWKWTLWKVTAQREDFHDTLYEV